MQSVFLTISLNLRSAIDKALSTFNNNIVDHNKALTNRLRIIKDRIEYMIAKKVQFKDTHILRKK
jgi:hypothetical protein